MQSWERLRQDALPPGFYIDEIPAEAKQSFSLAMLAFVISDAHGFWLEPKDGDGHCDPDKFTYRIAERLSTIGTVFTDHEVTSPIEARLVGALVWMDCDWAGFPNIDAGGPHKHIESYGPSEGVAFYITPQAKVGAYRVDFLLWFICGKHTAGVIVECDGHDYHDRTKEQAARDKKRDRDLLLAGYPVMRFTGSEIFKDALACAEQARQALSDPLHQVSEAGGLFGPKAGGNA